MGTHSSEAWTCCTDSPLGETTAEQPNAASALEVCADIRRVVLKSGNPDWPLRAATCVSPFTFHAPMPPPTPPSPPAGMKAYVHSSSLILRRISSEKVCRCAALRCAVAACMCR